ncbi:hypothetical protein, partial [Microcoleus sp.]|uniref:hypothetical protein n=1 Tax=Microcoleus sp. TaxID=44472 RepID=UPI003526A3D7
IAGGDARVLTYSTCLFCTLPSLWRSHNPSYVKCDRYIQQALTSFSVNADKLTEFACKISLGLSD